MLFALYHLVRSHESFCSLVIHSAQSIPIEIIEIETKNAAFQIRLLRLFVIVPACFQFRVSSQQDEAELSRSNLVSSRLNSRAKLQFLKLKQFYPYCIRSRFRVICDRQLSYLIEQHNESVHNCYQHQVFRRFFSCLPDIAILS